MRDDLSAPLVTVNRTALKPVLTANTITAQGMEKLSYLGVMAAGRYMAITLRYWQCLADDGDPLHWATGYRNMVAEYNHRLVSDSLLMLDIIRETRYRLDNAAQRQRTATDTQEGC